MLTNALQSSLPMKWLEGRGARGIHHSKEWVPRAPLYFKKAIIMVD